MNLRYLCALLALALLLGGCGNAAQAMGPVSSDPPEVTAEPTVPATIPADGNPEDVTCQGSYTGPVSPEEPIAIAGEYELSLGQLQVWYWAEVAQYRQDHPDALDYEKPLDSQPCEEDPDVNSWQQFFLKKALNRWHTAAALKQQGIAEGAPLEEAFVPEKYHYRHYIDGMPASKVLYGYGTAYEPNSMHQSYLDALPELFSALAEEQGYGSPEALAQALDTTAEDLTEYGQLLNWAYFYFTELSYHIEPTAEEMAWEKLENPEQYPAISGRLVDHHQIWIEKTPEETIDDCYARCEKILKDWSKKWRHSESTFAQLASEISEDGTMAHCGGAYESTRPGQLDEVLDGWLFDESRNPGDTTVLVGDGGCWIVYLDGYVTESQRFLKEQMILTAQQAILDTAREMYPLGVEYGRIALGEGRAAFAVEDVLYDDLAHERFPEVPLYLQQDYADTMYGGYKITTNGCGITSMAMLASYMADDELTPPEMCERFGSYSFSTGTDGSLFENEPGGMGFFLLKKTYEWREARDYLREGHIVIVVQHKGYWTSGGHYLVLEKMSEDGRVQVRDSNIYNYSKLANHKIDLFGWDTIAPQGQGYWIYQYKIKTIPACARCGDGEALALRGRYTCQKCQKAELRLGTYLAG